MAEITAPRPPETLNRETRQEIKDWEDEVSAYLLTIIGTGVIVPTLPAMDGVLREFNNDLRNNFDKGYDFISGNDNGRKDEMFNRELLFIKNLVAKIKVEMELKFGAILSENLLSQSSRTNLLKNIRKALRQYKNRMRMIFRTESNRMINLGVILKGEVNDYTRKWMKVVLDNRTSNICRTEHSKYGSPEQSIPIDKNFIVLVGGVTYSNYAPPIHQNCRSRVVLVN